jgi:hypothetical protein
MANEDDRVGIAAPATDDRGQVGRLLAALGPLFAGGEFARMVSTSLVGFAAAREYEEARSAWFAATGMDAAAHEKRVAALEDELHEALERRRAIMGDARPQRPDPEEDTVERIASAMLDAMELRMASEASGDVRGVRRADYEMDRAMVRLLARRDSLSGVKPRRPIPREPSRSELPADLAAFVADAPTLVRQMAERLAPRGKQPSLAAVATLWGAVELTCDCGNQDAWGRIADAIRGWMDAHGYGAKAELEPEVNELLSTAACSAEWLRRATDADLALLACTYAETRVREWALDQQVLLERDRVTAIEMQRGVYIAPAVE